MSTRSFVSFFFLILGLFFISCQGDQKGSDTPDADSQSQQTTGESESSGTPDDAAISSDMEDAADMETENNPLFSDDNLAKNYALLLDGEWRNLSSADLVFKFGSNRLVQSLKNQPTFNEPFTIHVKCESGDCKPADGSQVFGWCLKAGSQCYEVYRLDKAGLKMKDYSTGKMLEFRRVE